MFLFLQSIDTTIFWPGILILGFVIGFLSGTFGVGGGFLLIPLLRYVFGVPFEYAIGSTLCAITLSSISGAVVHYRRGNVSLQLGLLFLCGSIPGVELGTRLLNALKTVTLHQGTFATAHTFDFVIGCCFVILLLFSAGLMFKDALKFNKSNSEKTVIRDMKTYKLHFFYNNLTFSHLDCASNTDYVNGIYVIILGTAVGVLSGFLGIGGGIIVTPVLISLAGLPSVLVIGTSLFQLTITAASGAVLHAVRGNVNLTLVGLIAVTSIFGSIIGSRVTSKMRGKKIRVLYAVFLLLSTVFICIEMYLNK